MANRRFSVAVALGDGFRLVGRRPLTVWVWGLILLVPSLVVLAVALAVTGLPVFDDAEIFADNPGQLYATQIFTGLMAVNLLSHILQVVVGVVVMTAVVRVILGHDRRRPFGLGLGLTELRLGVSHLSIVVGLTLVIFCLGLLIAAVGMVAAGQITQAQRPWVFAAMAFAVLLPMLAMHARLSLIPPTSAALGAFAFEEGWRLGRNQTGRLTLLALLTVVAAGLVAVAVVTAVLGMGLAMAAGAQAWPVAWRSAEPVVVAVSITGAVAALAAMAGTVTTIGLAPYASVVRQLSPAPEQPRANATSDL